MILNDLMPHHHFSERHQIRTEACPRHLFQALLNMDLSNSIIAKLLYKIRGMPATSLSIDGMNAIGFNVLGINHDKELVIGLVGRFWRPVPQIINIPPDQFSRFNEKGYAKAAINYLIQDTQNGIRLSTETMIFCTSIGARIAFFAYWVFIRPFSGIIRQLMLKEIVKSAEHNITLSK